MTKTKELKSLNMFVKLGMTLVLLISLFNLWTYYDPVTAWKLIGSWKTLELMNGILNALFGATMVMLFVRIWRNKKLAVTDKRLWTVLVILVPVLFGTWYIWRLENRPLRRVN